MKIFITGGLGQVGSHIAELLLARGDEVLVIDNLATGRREHLTEHPRLTVVEGTIADKAIVDGLVGDFRPDVLVHTAASYKDPNDWYNDTLTNSVGGANLVAAAKAGKVGRFVYFQTALCYGVRPVEQPVTLGHPIDPDNSSYSITKTTTEQFLRLSGLDHVTFRLANVIGPRNVSGPLPDFIQRLTEGNINSVGGANLVAAARAGKVGRFVYFQTALCYGVRPVEQPVTLDHPIDPDNSSYSITKTTTEQFLRLSGLDHVTFRLANVIGPRNVSGPLPIFFQRLTEGKKCFVTKARRDFVYVGDLAESAVRAADGTGHGAYHFSSGGDVPILELYDAVVEGMQLNEYPEPEVRELGPDDAPSILLDPSSTVADFGPIEFTPLKETVRRAVAYYREFGVHGGYTHLEHD